MLNKRRISTIGICLTVGDFRGRLQEEGAAPAAATAAAPAGRRPAPPPPAPTITSFSAEPTSIERGQSSTLTWSVTDCHQRFHR